MKPAPENPSTDQDAVLVGYQAVLTNVVELLESARRTSARAVNAVMTATYWEIGRRIVEGEQGGENRAVYGERLIERLSFDLKERYGRGFGIVNLHQMRKFFMEWPGPKILQTASEESGQTDGPEASEPASSGVSLPLPPTPQFPPQG
jgi:hypothetical protein